MEQREPTEPNLTPAGQLFDLQPLDENLETEQLTTLLESNDVRIIRVVIPGGRNVPRHESEGVSILHCLQGRVELRTPAGKSIVDAGQLICLMRGEPFSIYGVENSALLVTIVRPKLGPNVKVMG